MLCLLFLRRFDCLLQRGRAASRTVPQVQANSTILAWGVEKRQTDNANTLFVRHEFPIM